MTFLSGANAGEVRKVIGNSGGTVTLDSDLPVAVGAGDSYTIERELEVRRIGDSTAAAGLKIEAKAELNQNLLKGGILNLNNDPGVASRMRDRLDVMTRSGDGMISIRTDALDDTIQGLNESIEKIEARVKAMEERLVREFARLEVILAQSQQTMTRLQSSLGAVVGMMASSSGGV